MGAMGRFAPLMNTEVTYDLPPDLAQMQTLGQTDYAYSDQSPQQRNSAKPLQQNIMIDSRGRGVPGIAQDAGDGNMTIWEMGKDGNYHTTEEIANLPAGKSFDGPDAAAAQKGSTIGAGLTAVADVAAASGTLRAVAPLARTLKLGL